jgi:hypothetical protein
MSIVGRHYRKTFPFCCGMVEAGHALIACCLPSLKSLVSERGIQSAINSVRSAISLHSLPNRSGESKNSNESNNSRISKKTNSYGKIEDSTLDQAPLRGDNIMEMSASATHDHDSKGEILPGQVRVQREVNVLETAA